MSQHAEIVVIGAGPGGYPAAFAAADHGKKVVLVNEEQNPAAIVCRSLVVGRLAN